ncbi:MAG: nucleotidyltransferase family protein [Chloroflexi bacterium]|nr:nucleotidyltransferase family protein [Chloroflexota bacterium]
MKTPPKALILAAGKGTRLQTVLNDRPKPMAPLNGRPLLAYTIDWLKQYGIREIAINLHHHPQVITDYFGDGSAHDVRIHYAYEPTLLGTAGAVRNLDGFLDDDRPLLVVYGDVLTDMNLRDLLLFHHQNAANDANTGATLSLYRVPNVTEVGLVDIDERGRIHRFIEKPQPHEVFTDLANAGVLVIEPHVIEHIPCDGFCDFGRDLFPKLLAQDIPLYGWVAPPHAYILDIGTPEKYRRAQREWSIKAKVKVELTPQPQPQPQP